MVQTPYSICRNSKKTIDDDPKLINPIDPLATGSWNASPSTYRMGNGAALVVQFGLFEVVGDLQRMQPSVYHDLDRNAVCIFQG